MQKRFVTLASPLAAFFLGGQIRSCGVVLNCRPVFIQKLTLGTIKPIGCIGPRD
jgi:hypothetical protein